MKTTKYKSRFEFPKDLKSGDFVAVCPHFATEREMIIMSQHPYWGKGGAAKNDKGELAIFNATLTCQACSKLPNNDIAFRRTRFFGGRLNTGWWVYQ